MHIFRLFFVLLSTAKLNILNALKVSNSYNLTLVFDRIDFYRSKQTSIELTRILIIHDSVCLIF